MKTPARPAEEGKAMNGLCAFGENATTHAWVYIVTGALCVIGKVFGPLSKDPVFIRRLMEKALTLVLGLVLLTVGVSILVTSKMLQ